MWFAPTRFFIANPAFGFGGLLSGLVVRVGEFGCRVEGCAVRSLEFTVWGSGFGVEGLGQRVESFEFGSYGLGLRARGAEETREASCREALSRGGKPQAS